MVTYRKWLVYWFLHSPLSRFVCLAFASCKRPSTLPRRHLIFKHIRSGVSHSSSPLAMIRVAELARNYTLVSSCLEQPPQFSVLFSLEERSPLFNVGC
jgi:hypothetical protein